jgi:formylglycine-generating enzyme required for sulfatase activity
MDEVTQAEYQKVMGKNPSHFAPTGMGKAAVTGLETASHPVEMVSWNDAAEFCAKLSQQEKLKPFYAGAGDKITPLVGTGYRLPNESEWEFACRAGTTMKYWIGDQNENLVRGGWFNGNSEGRTHAAGELKANPFGLNDLHGNVWEWVQDGWDASDYGQFSEKTAINPNSPCSAGSKRVLRGGDWGDIASGCRSSSRSAGIPSDRYFRIGFRVSLPVDAVKQTLSQSANTGWHGWPADAPKPAIAPFNAAQAKQHQEDWAAYLKTTVEHTNSIGMKLRLIPPGEFLMGAPDSDADAFPQEKPQHRVRLTKPFVIGATEVTNRQFRQFIEVTKYVTQAESDRQGAFDINPKARRPQYTWNNPELIGQDGDNYPVRCVSWEDARRFCQWLTQTEGRVYRLPTEAEWECACRAGTVTRYSFGDGFSDTPSPPRSSGASLQPVSQLPANPFGLFDMHGSLNEICWDSGRVFTGEDVTDPMESLEMNVPAVVRGGAVSSQAARIRSSNRYLNDARQFPESNFATLMKGFRVVAEFGPPPAIAPFDAAQARAHQEAWAKHLGTTVETTNSVGAKMILIPPGEFLMGSTPEQNAVGRKIGEKEKLAPADPYFQRLPTEMPQHQVTIRRPFLISSTEITIGQFKKFASATKYQTEPERPEVVANPSPSVPDKPRLTYLNPGYAVTDESPAAVITWNDAVAYCQWLTSQEKTIYRLPTEAEWEYACRAGTATQFSFGDDYNELPKYGWHNKNAGGKSRPVGQLLPNNFGLFDMHGNLWEWCGDSWDDKWYEKSSANDPIGPPAGSARVLRGGYWRYGAYDCRSACRFYGMPSYRLYSYGFRCVRELHAPSTTASVTPQPIVPAAATSPKLLMHDPAFPQWVKEVQAMPAEKQVEAVSKKLVELNSGFDGKLGSGWNGQILREPKVENGVVTELMLFTDKVTDISPLRVLSGLKTLTCMGSDFNGILTDISPLRGMQLTTLLLQGNRNLTDISPLKGMPLTHLQLFLTGVTNLTHLNGMPLKLLGLRETAVVDLSPLKDMKLNHLDMLGCRELTDLSPLKDMQLEILTISQTKVSELSLLAGMPLKVIELDFKPERDTELLRSIKTLEKINFKPAAEFWKEVEEQKKGK